MCRAAVFHVDSVVIEGKVVFAAAHAYMDAPMVVAHGGGVFQVAFAGT